MTKGSKTFTTSSTGAYTVGTRVRVAYTPSPAGVFMEGTVTAVTLNTSITVNIDVLSSGFSGLSGWTFSVAAGQGYGDVTSGSSITIGTGSVVFTISSTTNGSYTIGSRVRASSVSSPSNFMEGIITDIVSNTFSVNVDIVGGSGTYNNWSFSIAGERGLTGPMPTLGTNVATFLATPTSANLASAVTDETGSGSLVFSANPTFSGTVSGITKGMVGLGNVDNTSDANKPLSTVAQNESDYLRALTNNLSDAIADLNARTPFRMEVRSTDVGGASAVMKAVGVTFTSGRFTLAPRVTATVASTNTGALIATVDSLGSTGFTLRLRHSDNVTFSGTFPVSWIAIQRSSGAASG
jgi:hypothetical protein